MNKKFYLIASLLFASVQMGQAQNSIVKSVGVKDIPTVKAPAQSLTQVTKLTGWTHTTRSGETENVSVQYDDKGRFKVIDHGTYKELISYVDGTHGQWIEMTITKAEGATSTPQYKNVRTQDDQGRVVTEKVYENTDGEHLALTHSYAYAYSMVDNAERISLIENMKYDEDTPNGTGTKYVWCEPTQSYIENRYEQYNRTMTTLKDGTYSTLNQMYNEGKKTWVTIESEDIRYDDKGEQTYRQKKTYTPEGQFLKAEGQKSETSYNTPTTGYHTILCYTFTDGNDEDDSNAVNPSRSTDSQPNLANYQWVPSQKKVISDNYDNEQLTYGENKSYKVYEYANGNWTLAIDMGKEWVNKHVMKDFYDDHNYKNDAGYFYYDDNGHELGSAYIFNDGRYMSEINMGYQVNGRHVIEYTLYDAQHNILKKYRETFFDDSKQSTTGPTLFQEWDGTGWRNYVGTFLQGEGAFSETNITDEQGRIIDSYEYDDAGNIERRITTTYQDIGYTETEYKWKEDHSGLFANAEYIYSIDGNGMYQSISFDYDEDHNINFGTKSKEYTNGVQEGYVWNGSGWELVNTSISALTTTNGDETTTIYREVKNGNIVETEKRIEVMTANYTKQEKYVKQDDKWIGQFKTESRKVNYHTDFATTPGDPLQDYYDKSNTIDTSDSDASMVHNWDRAEYQWDETTGNWKVYTSQETTFQTIGNTLTQTVKNIEQAGAYRTRTQTTQTIYERDVQMRLTSIDVTETITFSDSSDGDNSSSHRVKLYTYDDEGNLLSEQTTNAYGTEKYIYRYGKIDVVNGIESPLDIPRGTICITGRTIRVAGAQGLALYLPSGAMVAQDKGDVIEAPTRGLYILVSKNKKAKIIVK